MKKFKTITLVATISLLFSSQLFAGQVSLMKPPIVGEAETNASTTEGAESWIETFMKALLGS